MLKLKTCSRVLGAAGKPETYVKEVTYFIFQVVEAAYFVGSVHRRLKALFVELRKLMQLSAFPIEVQVPLAAVVTSV